MQSIVMCGILTEMPTSTRKRTEFLTPAQAANVLGRSRSMVYYLIQTGALPSYRIKGTRRLLIDRKDLESVNPNPDIVEVEANLAGGKLQ